MTTSSNVLKTFRFSQLSSEAGATGILTLSSGLFAVMALLVRWVGGALSPAQIVLVRFLVGLSLSMLWFAFRRKGPSLARWRLLILRGAMGGAAVYTYFMAIDSLGVGPATLLNYSAPIYASLFSAFFLKERLTIPLIIGICLATLGSMAVAFSTHSGNAGFTLGTGAIAGLLSAVFSGAAMTIIRSLRNDTDAPTVFFAFCLVGGLMAMPLAANDFRPLTSGAVGLAVGVGVVSFVAQLLFTYAFGFVSASVGSVTLQLTPVFSWVLAVVILKEPVRAMTVFGAVLCVAGIWMGTRRPKTGAAS